MADHVQRVMKPNFAASWEEVGEENQVEETFALSTMKTIQGRRVYQLALMHGLSVGTCMSLGN